MSRPCFALSVMLCCMAGPLLIIGKTHAQDTIVSPGHDPGECIVCPLAAGLFEVCGGYSDYDYNKYWLDAESRPATKAPPQAVPELEVAQSPTDSSTEVAWESGYEDYYADYVFGDGAPPADSPDSHTAEVTLEETPSPVALIDADREIAPTPTAPQSAGAFKLHDEFGWYTDDNATAADYFDSYDEYEPIVPTETASPSAAEAAIDYEAYENEWFSYGSESSNNADEAYEALSESAGEAYSEGILNAQSAESLITGYDTAYDEAIAMDWNAAEPNEVVLKSEAEELSHQAIDSKPAWLTELVDRMLSPVWTVKDSVASYAPILNLDSQTACNADECAQEWDCEMSRWAHPQSEQPSVVLQAADTLDGMASALQSAAELLRRFASGSLAETAQTAKGGSPR